MKSMWMLTEKAKTWLILPSAQKLSILSSHHILILKNAWVLQVGIGIQVWKNISPYQCTSNWHLYEWIQLTFPLCCFKFEF